MISAYGPAATAYAERLGDVEAVITEFSHIGTAYVEAVRRRNLGERFYGLVCVDDPRVAFGYRHGHAILAQIPGYDDRCIVADRLASGELTVNGARADSLWNLDVSAVHVATEFLWLCDALLVRSFVEYLRIVDWFRDDPIQRPVRPVERILARATVLPVERVPAERPGVVLWAPQCPALHTALHLHGLAEFRGDVTCVTAGGPLPADGRAVFLAPGDERVAAALSRATAVVCIDPSDPSDAVAFAAAGYGVVAPLTSGAHEFASSVVAWDALDARFLPAAIASARAKPVGTAVAVPAVPRTPAPPARPAFVSPAELPLVTVITPTYNRRAFLREMLTGLAAQTYPNIESIVVNDAGEAVDDIVAEFPFARLINKERNAGGPRAALTGWEHARGEYIGVLSDDECYYPDHIERMVNGMLRSGAKIAHGACLLRYIELRENGAWLTFGYNATTFCQTINASDTLISTTIGTMQALVHRSIYEEVGWYLLDSEIADNELHMRVTPAYFYAFDDHVTTEFRDHASGMGRKSDFPSALRQVYDEYHPVTGRPLIDAMRAATIAHIASRPPGEPPFTPTLRLVQ
jgi:hypothetical protein